VFFGCNRRRSEAGTKKTRRRTEEDYRKHLIVFGWKMVDKKGKNPFPFPSFCMFAKAGLIVLERSKDPES
jgi:hypothetical protein